MPNSEIFIDDEVFAGCSSRTSVEISDTVTFIGKDLFDGFHDR